MPVFFFFLVTNPLKKIFPRCSAHVLLPVGRRLTKSSDSRTRFRIFFLVVVDCKQRVFQTSEDCFDIIFDAPTLKMEMKVQQRE